MRLRSALLPLLSLPALIVLYSATPFLELNGDRLQVHGLAPTPLAPEQPHQLRWGLRDALKGHGAPEQEVMLVLSGLRTDQAERKWSVRSNSQGMLPIDIPALAPGAWRLSAFTPQGKLLQTHLLRIENAVEADLWAEPGHYTPGQRGQVSLHLQKGQKPLPHTAITLALTNPQGQLQGRTQLRTDAWGYAVSPLQLSGQGTYRLALQYQGRTLASQTLSVTPPAQARPRQLLVSTPVSQVAQGLPMTLPLYLRYPNGAPVPSGWIQIAGINVPISNGQGLLQLPPNAQQETLNYSAGDSTGLLQQGQLRLTLGHWPLVARPQYEAAKPGHMPWEIVARQPGTLVYALGHGDQIQQQGEIQLQAGAQTLALDLPPQASESLWLQAYLLEQPSHRYHYRWNAPLAPHQGLQVSPSQPLAGDPLTVKLKPNSPQAVRVAIQQAIAVPDGDLPPSSLPAPTLQPLGPTGPAPVPAPLIALQLLTLLATLALTIWPLWALRQGLRSLTIKASAQGVRSLDQLRRFHLALTGWSLAWLMLFWLPWQPTTPVWGLGYGLGQILLSLYPLLLLRRLGRNPLVHFVGVGSLGTLIGASLLAQTQPVGLAALYLLQALAHREIALQLRAQLPPYQRTQERGSLWALSSLLVIGLGNTLLLPHWTAQRWQPPARTHAPQAALYQADVSQQNHFQWQPFSFQQGVATGPYTTTLPATFLATPQLLQVRTFDHQGQSQHYQHTFTTKAEVVPELSPPAYATVGDLLFVPITSHNLTAQPKNALLTLQGQKQRFQLPAHKTRTSDLAIRFLRAGQHPLVLDQQVGSRHLRRSAQVEVKPIPRPRLQPQLQLEITYPTAQTRVIGEDIVIHVSVSHRHAQPHPLRLELGIPAGWEPALETLNDAHIAPWLQATAYLPGQLQLITKPLAPQTPLRFHLRLRAQIAGDVAWPAHRLTFADSRQLPLIQTPNLRLKTQPDSQDTRQPTPPSP